MTILSVAVPPDATEVGHPGGLEPAWHHELGAGYVAASYEENPELTFPNFVRVADLMRRTDGQVGALIRSIMLPIIRNRHSLATAGVPAAIVKFVETEIGLHADDHERQRPRGGERRGVVLKEHMRQALLAVPIGFMPFERTYSVSEPTIEQAAVSGMPDLVAHLQRLAPRMPRTVQEIRVHKNGDLDGIIQAGVGWDVAGRSGQVQVIGGTGSGGALGADDSLETWIPADRLTYYCFEREGADWAGTSILRPVYKDWLIKDQLIRTDAIAGERNGMGVPVVYYAEGGTKGEALQIAAGFRSGSTAGAAVEDGKYRVELLGTQGAVKDLLPSIKYHDQSVSRSALAMFLDLGQTSSGLGQGSLGDTFLDYFVMALQTVDDWWAAEFTESVIRDLVAINFGVDAPYPALVADEISAESTPTAEALKMLVEAKLIVPDDDLEKETRRRYRLAPKQAGAPETTGVMDPPAPFPPSGDDPAVEGVPESGEAPTAAPEPATAPASVPVDPATSDPLLDRVSALVESISRLRAAGV